MQYPPSRLLSQDEIKTTKRAIRRYARQIAERFQPERIILFGSFAYGTPNEDSDVDLLIIMPTRGEISQMVRIRMAFDPPPFAMDMLVRTPDKLCRRLATGDSFLKEVMSRGKTLYEKGNKGVGAKSGRRPAGRRLNRPGRPSRT
jgi:predicted nucleotidyltransferase